MSIGVSISNELLSVRIADSKEDRIVLENAIGDVRVYMTPAMAYELYRSLAIVLASVDFDETEYANVFGAEALAQIRLLQSANVPQQQPTTERQKERQKQKQEQANAHD